FLCLAGYGMVGRAGKPATRTGAFQNHEHAARSPPAAPAWRPRTPGPAPAPAQTLRTSRAGRIAGKNTADGIVTPRTGRPAPGGRPAFWQRAEPDASYWRSGFPFTGAGACRFPARCPGKA